MESIWESQPFDLLGVDNDHGGKFLNCHLYPLWKDHGIEQTRSRPYHKGDQAYVEQRITPTAASSSATKGSPTGSCWMISTSCSSSEACGRTSSA